MDEEIKTRLQHLNGQPLSVIYRNINNIVTDLRSSQESVTQLISSLSYKDSFERLLKIKIIDSFKLTQFVVELLISEDPHLITCVLQFKWFFEGEDKSIVNVDYFNTNVVPYTSVSTRGKIIKCLALNLKNEQQAEEFCCFIQKQYGDLLAASFLPSCSIPFVLAFQSSSNVALTSAQLIHLFNKSQDFVQTFLIDSLQDTCKCIRDYMMFIDFLAHNHPDLYFKLYKSHKENFPRVNLGRRSSKKIILANKSVIIDSADKFIDLFQIKYIHKLFSPEEFETLFCKLFTQSFGKLLSYSSWSASSYVFERFSLIHHLPDDDKVKFMISIFQKRYGKNLLDYYDFIPEYFARMLPLEEKRKYFEKMLPRKNPCWEDWRRYDLSVHSEIAWICYSPVHESIPKIKEFINEYSDVNSRSEIVPYFVKTCKINNDTSALLEVLQYFVARFRNDDVKVRESFIETLLQEFDLLKLSEEHWHSLYELLQISIFNKELTSSWIFIQLLKKYICYSISSSNPHLQTLIEQFIKYYCFSLKSDLAYHGYSLNEPRFQKQFLILIGNTLPTVQNIENISDPVTINIVVSFLRNVCKWNVEHRNDQISVVTFPWVLPSLSLIFQSGDSYDIVKLIKIIYHERALKEIFFSVILLHTPEPHVVMRFLKHADHFDESVWTRIITYMLERSYFMRYRVILRKIMSVVPEKAELLAFLRPKCKELAEQNTENLSCRALYVLSLIDPETFFDITRSVHPGEPKVNVFAEGSQDLFEKQKMVTKCLAHIKPFTDFNLLLPFCQGDYLKLVLGSLYSILLNTAEVRLLPLLKELSRKPVSVKQHSIRMLYRVLSIEKIIDVLSNLLKYEKHPSIRKVLIEEIINFFSLKPTPQKFELLKSAISSLTTKDKISFDLVPSAVNVPDSYKSEIFQLCWNVLLSLNSGRYNTRSLCVDLLYQLDDNFVTLLADDFLKGLISQYLFKLDSDFHSEVKGICIKYILNSESSDVAYDRITYFLQSLADFTFITEKKQLYPSRKFVSDFVHAFLTESLNFEEKEVSVQMILGIFLAHYSSHMEGSNFKYFILFQIYYFYFDFKDNPNKIRFGETVGEFIDKMVAQYGPLVISVITDSLSNFSSSLNFVAGILSNTSSPNCMIAGIELLEIHSYDKEKKEKIKEMLTILLNYEGKNKPLVQAYLYEKVAAY